MLSRSTLAAQHITTRRFASYHCKKKEQYVEKTKQCQR